MVYVHDRILEKIPLDLFLACACARMHIHTYIHTYTHTPKHKDLFFKFAFLTSRFHVPELLYPTLFLKAVSLANIFLTENLQMFFFSATDKCLMNVFSINHFSYYKNSKRGKFQ